jgi:hypothetical protein
VFSPAKHSSEWQRVSWQEHPLCRQLRID